MSGRGRAGTDRGPKGRLHGNGAPTPEVAPAEDAGRGPGSRVTFGLVRAASLELGCRALENGASCSGVPCAETRAMVPGRPRAGWEALSARTSTRVHLLQNANPYYAVSSDTPE